MKVEEILNECRNLVEQICQKFGYSDQDKEGNDSLKTVLLKVIPAMLKDSNQDDRNLFYQMLSHTPIVITENLTQESYNKLLEQYIGKNVNQHIIEENVDLGEYGSNLAAGAYVSEAILDENMNLQGKKSFIYIQKVTEKAKNFYGTDINVPHLIHELGHAWHAEKNEFVMQKDGTLKNRVGFAEFIYSFSKTQDNKFVRKCISATGLMIEESMNTVAEEIAMANYMGISLEQMRKEYRNSLIPSVYQGYMVYFAEHMLLKLDKDEFEKYRLYGETEIKDKINDLLKKTDYWINREKDILPSSDSPRSYDKKKNIIDKIDNIKVQNFFTKYKTIYFPDISKMTPLEKLDNVLTQVYNMNMVKYNMGSENYRAFLERLGYEGFSLINQASALENSKNKQESSNAEKITPATAVKNALKQGTTIEQVVAANNVEQTIQNEKHVKRGEARND